MTVIAPRRDEIALSKNGFLSQRMITYLEDITQTTNYISNNITSINEYIIGEMSKSIDITLIDNTKKDLENINNIVFETQNSLYFLITENKYFHDNFIDIQNFINELNSNMSILIADNKKIKDNYFDLINIINELKSYISIITAESSNIKKELADLQQLHIGGF